MSTGTFQFAIVIFICAYTVSVADFIRNPEKYGEIMRRFDEARYGAGIAE